MQITDFHSLFERRRNPSQNPKVGTVAALEKYRGQDVFVTFTSDLGAMYSGRHMSFSKLGINPQSSFDTPIGIYTYPIDYVLNTGIKKLPFANDRPFMQVVRARTTMNVVDVKNYTNTDLEHDLERIRKFSKFDRERLEAIIQEGIDNAKSEAPIAAFWNTTRLLALALAKEGQGKASVQWTAILRGLGYGAFVDHGTGLIHDNEPHQAVFLGGDVVELVETIRNKKPETTPAAVFAQKPQLFITAMRSGKVDVRLFWETVAHGFYQIETMPESLRADVIANPDIARDVMRRLADILRSSYLVAARRLLPKNVVDSLEAERNEWTHARIAKIISAYEKWTVIGSFYRQGDDYVIATLGTMSQFISDHDNSRSHFLSVLKGDEVIDLPAQEDMLRAFIRKMPNAIERKIGAALVEHKDLISDFEDDGGQSFDPNFPEDLLVWMLENNEDRDSILYDIVMAAEHGFETGSMARLFDQAVSAIEGIYFSVNQSMFFKVQDNSLNGDVVVMMRADALLNELSYSDSIDEFVSEVRSIEDHIHVDFDIEIDYVLDTESAVEYLLSLRPHLGS